MRHLKETDPEVYEAVRGEMIRQKTHLELIASENIVSEAVLEAQGSVLTNKYAEGYPGRRWYGGCAHVDVVERLAVERAKALFGAEHVNVQPHSGSQANQAVYDVAMKPGETVLAMDLACGGHLTHGHSLNFSGRTYHVVSYKVDPRTERLDYEAIRALARESRPRMILAGASAYSRTIDFAAFRSICDEVGALLFVDMAHIAGLVAAGLHPNPVPVADFVTTTTHKTLRGPRGGMILCREAYARKIDVRVFPGIQGGPLMHVIAAKAVALGEALKEDFREDQRRIVRNAATLAEGLSRRGYRIVAGGTDNHLFMADLRPKGITGKDAAEVLDRVNITVNKNLIPFDPQPPLVTSGVRIGTPAVTTRGMGEAEMERIAGLIDEALTRAGDPAGLDKVRASVLELAEAFPIYPDREG